MEGWIKLHRLFLAWEWFNDPNMVKLYIYLLLSANHKDGKWRGQDIKRGQLIRGINTLSSETGISKQTLRTCLKRLKETGEINTQANTQNTIITICKYDSYQTLDVDTNTQANTPLTHDQHTTNTRLTTNKNDNNKKNDKNKSKNTKNHLFKNSIIYEFEMFEKIMSEYADGKYANADMNFYYESVKNWSAAGNKVKTDWVATTANFMLKDINDNKFRKK